MFTGLVECMGRVASLREMPAGKRLRVDMPFAGELRLGESVAINGCCLTVVANDQTAAEFEAGPETLRLTNLGDMATGDMVNLERSLRADGRLGGHIVQGHIDGLGELIERRTELDWDFLRFEAGALADNMVPKGSVAVDGVSLTIVDVAKTTFSVMIVPHTSTVTTLGTLPLGAKVNLEVDILGKYVFQYLQRIQSNADK